MDVLDTSCRSSGAWIGGSRTRTETWDAPGVGHQYLAFMRAELDDAGYTGDVEFASRTLSREEPKTAATEPGSVSRQ